VVETKIPRAIPLGDGDSLAVHQDDVNEIIANLKADPYYAGDPDLASRLLWDDIGFSRVALMKCMFKQLEMSLTHETFTASGNTAAAPISLLGLVSGRNCFVACDGKWSGEKRTTSGGNEMVFKFKDTKATWFLKAPQHTALAAEFTRGLTNIDQILASVKSPRASRRFNPVDQSEKMLKITHPFFKVCISMPLYDVLITYYAGERNR
jgi:hypothetical protein